MQNLNTMSCAVALIINIIMFSGLIAVKGNQYGLELELLSIKNVASHRPWQSLQYDLEVEARNDKGDTHLLGTVTLTAVLGQSELIFQEVTGKNPFSVTRIGSGDLACFRLMQINFDHLIEQCYRIKDSSDFYRINNFNATLSEGSTLFYKWSQHLLKGDEFNTEFFQDDFSIGRRNTGSSSSSSSNPSETSAPTTTASEANSSPLCNCQSCTVPIVFASLEAAILLPIILVGIYFGISKIVARQNTRKKQTSVKQTRPTIMVIRPGQTGNNNSVNVYDDSGVSSVSSLSDHRVDIQQQQQQQQQNAYNDVSEAITGERKTSRPTGAPDTFKAFPVKVKSSTLSVNNKLGEASASLRNTLASTGHSLANTGRKLKEKINEKKTPTTPPMPPPPDYPHQLQQQQNQNKTMATVLSNAEDNFDQRDDYDDLYDVIELEDTVDETASRQSETPTNATLPKPPPKAPSNVPVKSFVHSHVAVAGDHVINDASQARDRAKKFSYVN